MEDIISSTVGFLVAAAQLGVSVHYNTMSAEGYRTRKNSDSYSHSLEVRDDQCLKVICACVSIVLS